MRLLTPVTSVLFVLSSPPHALPVRSRAPAPQANLEGRIVSLRDFESASASGDHFIPPPKVRLITDIPELKELIRDVDSTRIALMTSMLEDAFAGSDIEGTEEEAYAKNDRLLDTDDDEEGDGCGGRVMLGPSWPA